MTATQQTYEDCLTDMYGLRRFGIKLGLSTIRDILSGLGDPHTKYRIIHVAGTNGKGSVACSLSTILHLAGYKTGIFTSPHLVRYNERICINNRQISDEAVIEGYHAVKEAHGADRELTFFEFSAAMAFYEFTRQKVDWAVIETGMGGRLDATNVCTPELSIITNISLEHQMYLGNKLSEIAQEKAGIIKKEVPVITAARQDSVITVIQKKALEMSAPLFRLGEDFKVRRCPNGTFHYYGMEETLKGMRTALPGYHQVDNAALAIAACEVLREKGVDLPESAIRNGLAAVQWPGRLEVVSQNPFILLDGAHNLMAARNLASHFAKDLSHKRIILVVGILDDKPYKQMLQALVPVCAKAIVTRAQNERALPARTLLEAAKEEIADVEMAPDVPKAVDRALETAGPEDAVCIAGSLYVVGEAREHLEKKGFFAATG